jgi:hypothetical protein
LNNCAKDFLAFAESYPIHSKPYVDKNCYLISPISSSQNSRKGFGALFGVGDFMEVTVFIFVVADVV